ncbi:MAG: trypsin-like peptidase domain-containing protein [Bacillota bacterium]|nr:trypsin-like peptidase domain-containing protein [Bacillota bacterium]
MKKLMSCFICVIVLISLIIPLGIVSAAEQTNSISSTSKLYDNIELPKISKNQVDKIKEKIKENNLKPVKQFTDEEKNNIKKIQDPYTSVSSQGVISTSKNSNPKKPNIANQNLAVTSSMTSTSETDNRELVYDTGVDPYNSVVQIDFYDQVTGDGYSCSGTYINSTTVLTASHCVYDAYNHRYYSGWVVYPGESGTYFPYYSYASTNAYVTSGWMNTAPPSEGSIYYNDVPYDFAVIKVNSGHPYSKKVSSDSTVGHLMTSIGYPGDHSYYSNGYYYYYMYKTIGYITGVNSNVMTHSAYVTSGMSGGPIMNTSNSVVSVNSTHSWAAIFDTYHLNVINNWALSN